MSELLPPWPLFSAFLLASLLLALTPGPGVLYIVARSLTQGRRSGLASVAGIALGNLGNAVAACLGLATLFAVSALAFTLVKYAGALYLIYLGLRMLRSARQPTRPATLTPQPLLRLFRDGVFVALFNPKTTVFFAAFLPQFFHSAGAPMLQGLVLGTLFVAIAALTDSLYALGAGTLAPLLSANPWGRQFGRYVSGCGFIALGLFTALSGTRTAK